MGTLSHARIIEQGYWGGKQFSQDLAPAEVERKTPTLLIAPFDSVHLLASQVAQIVVVVEQDQSRTTLLSDLEHSLSQGTPPIHALWVCNVFPFFR